MGGDNTAAVEAISTHALREEGDAVDARPANTDPSISTHALREEGDPSSRPLASASYNFYPRPPRGGRPVACVSQTYVDELFLPTPSARRATGPTASIMPSRQNFYPRPPRGGRPTSTPGPTKAADFYPRPPRGGRLTGTINALSGKVISTHALREEGDRSVSWMRAQAARFLPTPSARRATVTGRIGTPSAL